mgnify:CR=1 FL=1
MSRLIVDAIEGKGVGQNNDKNIQIRISGEDIKFIATEYSVSIFLNEDEADKIAFHLSTILQDRDYSKKCYPAEKVLDK